MTKQENTFVEITLSDEETNSRVEAIQTAFEIEMMRAGVEREKVESICKEASNRISGYVRNIDFSL